MLEMYDVFCSYSTVTSAARVFDLKLLYLVVNMSSLLNIYRLMYNQVNNKKFWLEMSVAKTGCMYIDTS